MNLKWCLTEVKDCILDYFTVVACGFLMIIIAPFIVYQERKDSIDELTFQMRDWRIK